MNFVDKDVVLSIHDFQLGAHGGSAGVRDAGLLESALARPKNKHAYGEEDAFSLAASYAFGIARNHPFMDGNKRTALHTALLFLRLNGIETPVPSIEMVERMVELAEGKLEEAAFAAWLAAQPPRILKR